MSDNAVGCKHQRGAFKCQYAANTRAQNTAVKRNFSQVVMDICH